MSSVPLIYQATGDDAAVVRDTMLQAFEEYRGKLFPPSGALSESLDQITDKITRSGGAFIAAVDGNPAGSIQYTVHPENGCVHLGRVAVLPAFRGRGIGSLLVQRVEAFAKQSGMAETHLGVRLSIPDNIAYYQKLGYHIMEKHAYPDNTDQWYIMAKRLE